jgi:hypothetical protein
VGRCVCTAWEIAICGAATKSNPHSPAATTVLARHILSFILPASRKTVPLWSGIAPAHCPTLETAETSDYIEGNH